MHRTTFYKRREICKELLKKVVKKLTLLSPKMVVKESINLLGKEKLFVADVGSTGGSDPKWKEVAPFCHFYSFDPDPRAVHPENQGNATLFPFGLWSSEVERSLHLTEFPSASSVFPLHQEELGKYANAKAHHILGMQKIQLQSMANVLKGHAPPDFIKVDAEGADLEILKGSEEFLKNSCLAIYVEVSFIERHTNAPFFSDTDIYLRSLGFFLADLSRVHWVRRNQVFGMNSKPQLVWGNALYVLSRADFLKRMASVLKEDRSLQAIKFLSILLLYQMHDYAEEIRDVCWKEQLIDQELSIKMQQAIKKSIPSPLFFWLKILFASFFSLIIFFLCLPIPSLRIKAASFLKDQIRKISFFLLNLAKGGICSCEVYDDG